MMAQESALRRCLVLLTASLFLAGGAWKAAQCLRVDRQSLPVDALATAAAGLGAEYEPPGGASPLACSPSLQLTLVQLAAAPSLLLNSGTLCQLLEQVLAVVPLLPSSTISAAALLHPPPPPHGGLAHLAAAHGTRAQALQYGRQLLQLALDTHQVPASTANTSRAGVLVYVEEGPGEEAAGQRGGSAQAALVQALELGDDVLVVFVTGASWLGAGQGPQQPAVNEAVAAAVGTWLGQAVDSSGGNSSSGSGAGSAATLAAACLGAATAYIGQLLSALRSLPDQPASPELASLVDHVLRATSAAQHAQQQGLAGLALRHAREAWAASRGLQHHPGFGVQPLFPLEHQLAVLLPLTLPMVLVVARATGKEVATWKQERRAGAQAKQARKDEQLGGGNLAKTICGTMLHAALKSE